MEQPNYDKKLLKRKWQEKFFKSSTNKTKFVGLCGTNPLGYIKTIIKAGFNNILLYDLNIKNLQHLAIEKYNVKTVNGDINDSLGIINGRFIDLDYCCIVDSIKKYLPRIMKIDEFTMTLSLRGASEEKTLNILHSYKRNFLYRVYREGGCPMMILYFPNKK